MISAPCTNHLIRGGLVRGIAAGDPSTAVGAYVDRTQCSMRTARIDRQSCMRSSHAPRTRNPEPRVRENRKTESRKTDSGTVCRKTPSDAGAAPPPAPPPLRSPAAAGTGISKLRTPEEYWSPDGNWSPFFSSNFHTPPVTTPVTNLGHVQIHKTTGSCIYYRVVNT